MIAIPIHSSFPHLLFYQILLILNIVKNILKLILCIAFCQAVGIIGAIFTFDAIPTWYVTLNKPFFSPPNWVFGPVWTILYTLMGISFFLIIKKGWNSKKILSARNFFLAQLLLNFIWTPIFFGLKLPLLALFVILGMDILTVATIKKSYAISKWAAYLLIPYLAWISFATLLNAAIAVLN
jgi:tryptophan-rich sensory protein